MASLLIRGGHPLRGTVPISGSKNSALAIMAAAALADGESVLENIPQEADIRTMAWILQELGARVWLDDEGLHIDGSAVRNTKAPYELVRRMRGSFYVAGLLLGKLGRAEVPLPGGCAIGSRGVDFHLRGFEHLGASVAIEHGFVVARAKRLKGCKYLINRASVGATINMMLASCMAEGVTVLQNAAREPEVVDLAIYLNAMGAQIRGAGTDEIRIHGVDSLRGVRYSIISDRLEVGTYAMAAAITGGEITITHVVPEHLRLPFLKLEEAGVELVISDSTLLVKAPSQLQALDVETGPYPSFPTDLQQPIVSMLTLAEGTSVVRETVFDHRFRYVDELRRMGAEIKLERETAIVRGVPQLTGAPVEAPDLRGGAALLIAALAAEGETEIREAQILDRGYERLVEKLTGLGAQVERIPGEDDEEEVLLELPGRSAVNF